MGGSCEEGGSIKRRLLSWELSIYHLSMNSVSHHPPVHPPFTIHLPEYLIPICKLRNLPWTPTAYQFPCQVLGSGWRTRNAEPRIWHIVDTQCEWIEWIKEQQHTASALQVLGLAVGHRIPELRALSGCHLVLTIEEKCLPWGYTIGEQWRQESYLGLSVGRQAFFSSRMFCPGGQNLAGDREYVGI